MKHTEPLTTCMQGCSSAKALQKKLECPVPAQVARIVKNVPTIKAIIFLCDLHHMPQLPQLNVPALCFEVRAHA